MPPGSPPRPLSPAAAREAIARLEQQLRQAQKMEAAGLLAAGVAHDFNNLLTVINGYSDLLLHTYELPSDARALVEGIHEAGSQAAALTRALLAFSRRMPQEPRALDLNQCVRELAALWKRLLPPNIELTVTAGPELKTVRADPGSVQHALLNLVLNARDAMPEGGKLEIRIANLTLDAAALAAHPGLRPGCYVSLTVRDTGRGMDEETRRRIFEPFYTTRAEGSGLGLPMVQYLVKQNDGFLEVDSRKGAGTAVSICLPCGIGGPPPEAAQPVKPLSGGHETILVVDDNPEMRRFLRTTLESLGYTVVEAASAGEAATVARSFSAGIDLMVANASLADSTGGELARRLGQARPGLPALYLCSQMPPSAETAGTPGRAVDFLSKPFTVAALAERIRLRLERAKHPRILFVNEDAGLALLAVHALREAGYEVLVAANWKVALPTLETEHPDLVITDLAMTDRGGLETILALRKSYPWLPLIATSALGRHFLKSAEGLGASAILAKPFGAQDLLKAVRAALGTGGEPA